jgi:phosphoglycerol geranylgeranyltransferase
MKVGKVERYIHNKLEEDGALLLALVDPDKQPFEKGAQVAKAAYEGGADAILIGGSIGAQGMILDKTTKLIRENVDIPIILFPGSVGTATHYADAIYFMYLLNSKDVYWLSTAQIQGAPIVKRLGLEPIPTAYIIVEPGRAVGWISNANLIPRDRGDLAAATALAGEYVGARLIITDCGSGSPQPASLEMISAIKSQLTVPYFYAGGCRTPKQARDIIRAGADGIQIGTAFEIDAGYDAIKAKVTQMVRAVKEEGRNKLSASQANKLKLANAAVPTMPTLKFGFFKKRWEFLSKMKHRPVITPEAAAQIKEKLASNQTKPEKKVEKKKVQRTYELI